MAASWAFESLISSSYIAKAWKYRRKKVRNEKSTGWEMKSNHLKFDTNNNRSEFVQGTPKEKYAMATQH